MQRIKHTKTELKAQRDQLSRFERYLPMLQLKKKQLQMEIQAIDAQIAANEAKARTLREELGRWVRLFAEPVDVEGLVALREVITDIGNIAGVEIPILKDVVLDIPALDLFTTPTWFDDAQEVLAQLLRLKAAREVLELQRKLVSLELERTTQRVNLFEKVKIPECRENIRVIRIFLGDQQTAAVVRGKIAKKRIGED
ncbi:MAG: V-type ATP synthase subunit D [Kiritimatiellae bacterium]|nr:V-type ATP synthase subunit D [Kiritimatiellia bacterium]